VVVGAVAKCYRQIIFELDLKLPIFDNTKCIARVANRVSVSERTKHRAISLMNDVVRKVTDNPVKECKASVFAVPGTCKEIEGIVTKGPGGKVTITAPNYAPKSPIPSEQLKKFVNSIPICNFHFRNCATWLGQGQSITSRY
jgi:hypothetical protein